MEPGSLITSLDVERPDLLALFAHEAERMLSATYHSVRDSYGEGAASCVANKWLEIFEASPANRGDKFPNLRDITVQSIAYSLASCKERGHFRAAAFAPEIHEQREHFQPLRV
jgi:hypothetical protein